MELHTSVTSNESVCMSLFNIRWFSEICGLYLSDTSLFLVESLQWHKADLLLRNYIDKELCVFIIKGRETNFRKLLFAIIELSNHRQHFLSSYSIFRSFIQSVDFFYCYILMKIYAIKTPFAWCNVCMRTDVSKLWNCFFKFSWKKNILFWILVQ